MAVVAATAARRAPDAGWGVSPFCGQCDVHALCTSAARASCSDTDGSCTCKPGVWGSECQHDCPGGTGADACHGHGTCDDGASGTGVCVCDPGYTLDPESHSCVACPADSWKQGAGNGACTPCAGATTSGAVAQTTASACKCLRGFFRDGDGTCTHCPHSTYSDTLDAKACTACPARTHTLNTHSTSLGDCTCVRGTHRSAAEGPCELCPADTYQPGSGQRGSVKCVKCPALTTTDGKTGRGSATCLCKPGYTGAGGAGGQCQPCGASPPKYKSKAGSQACTTCPAGHVIQDGSNTATSAAACVCAPGRAMSNGECVKCGRRSYKPSASSAPSCTECPFGTTTVHDGATSVSACVASKGYYDAGR